MGSILSRVWHFALLVLVALCSFSDCYDPLDPNGNITVTFDILHWRDDGYTARVTIQNYYQFRHVDKPGWQLGWTWSKEEVIWSMSGAFATQRGNCSSFISQLPHSCKKDPVIVDLMPNAASENRSECCCHGGLLTAWAISPSESFSSFEMAVGNIERAHAFKPLNLTLMDPGPGYTCGPVEDTKPTVSSTAGGRREEEVIMTWKSTCTYSSYLANRTPICCVSFSAFYNPIITSCLNCSCGCKPADKDTKSCISEGYPTQTDFLQNADIVQCTDHMCPLRVHWHLKNNYVDHWRVKLTITNHHYGRNYSDWNVLVQHPGFSQSATTYSFNSTLLPTVGITDDVALFWGIDYYNDELLNADEKQVGSVATEILLKKDIKSFTLSNGWAFPRRIYFNGENCLMPLPDTFPMLPNGSSIRKPRHHHLILHFLVYFLTFKALVFWL